ncbi:helix-turn-helix domain-containing protein [Streptomyces fungicidicus]|uniref:helix-turn-helix domain-containing protein n=1 Tax=Streptomyces fungicidicus TaxID=68203 RepID=UPI00381C5F28
MSTAHARLTAVLRELRAGTGLSLAALSERTAYSKSSWERYLNGKSLPPRQAVRDLCRVADEPEGRALALWELAEAEGSGRAAAAPAPAAEEPRTGRREAPRPSAGDRHRVRGGRLPVLLVTVSALVASGVALGLLLLTGGETEAGEPPPGAAARCRGAACEGRDPMRLLCGIGPGSLATHRTATGAHVELRHSEKCAASWARAWGTRVGDRVELTVDGGTHAVRVGSRDDTETYVYTPMAAVRPGSTVRACFGPASADGERECFEARVGGTATTPPPAPSR